MIFMQFSAIGRDKKMLFTSSVYLVAAPTSTVHMVQLHNCFSYLFVTTTIREKTLEKKNLNNQTNSTRKDIL